MNSSNNEGKLANLRVLDLSQGGVQICGKILAELGADVIKVEPKGGDITGRIGPFYKDIPDPQKSLYWFAYNANKRSITLDIETIDGQQIFGRLAKISDIVIESFTPGYLDKLNVGYSALSLLNPAIILTSVTPFGQTGPKSQYKSCDLTAWACSGGLYATGDPDRPPVWNSFPQPLLHGGVEACLASLIAYFYRVNTGEGQHVDVSVQDTFIESTDQAHILTYDMTGFVYRRQGDRMGYGTQAGKRQLYSCKDGFIAFQAQGGSSPNIGNLVQCMKEEGVAPEWLVNYDWVHDYDSSRTTQEEVYRIEGELGRYFMTKTKSDLFAQAIKRGIMMVPVNTPEDICNAEQWKDRNLWVQVEHNELNTRLPYCALFSSGLSQNLGIVNRRAPLIGEHNLEIYEGELGLNREEIAALKSSGVI
jgi:benzylsuccinate CoA-transferase BbsE subunit